MDISKSVVENNLSEYHMSYSSYDWGNGEGGYHDNGDNED